MKVMITGGAGFIGYHLTNVLVTEGHQVVLVDNLTRGVVDDKLQYLLDNRDVTLQQRELLNSACLDDADLDYDIIFHLAAIIGVQHVLNRSYDVLNQNQVLLHNLIEFGRRQSNLKRFVFTSTSEIYAGTLKEGYLKVPTAEDSMLAITPVTDPRTSYMLSKIYGEAMCYQSGLDVTIIRPHNFYGPRMGLSHVIPELLKKVYTFDQDKPIVVYSPEHTRTFCYIEDAVQMMHRLSTSDKALNESFNIGNTQPEVRIIDLAQQIVDVVGRQVQIVTGEDTPGSPVRRCPQIAKAVETCGYTPQVSLEDGLERTWKWYKQNVFDNDSGVTAI